MTHYTDYKAMREERVRAVAAYAAMMKGARAAGDAQGAVKAKLFMEGAQWQVDWIDSGHPGGPPPIPDALR